MHTVRFSSSGGGGCLSNPPRCRPSCRQTPLDADSPVGRLSCMHTPPLNRQTCVKTLPCPKLRLRAVAKNSARLGQLSVRMAGSCHWLCQTRITLFLLATVTWFHTLNLIHYRPRKRSPGQGNIFTSVCHSVHEEGGRGQDGWLPSMHHRSHDQGVCIQGVCISGSLHHGGVCIQGGWADPQIYGILRDTVKKRTVRILRILVLSC